MTELHRGDTALRWTNTFFNTLAKFGVRHIVISPGSRSTPLTLAAAANSYFQKHVVLDERSAAFTALGIGKATSIPSVLVCTSGTAVANYYPAVIEARQSGVPLILATADRPPHLRATGANQAIDQLKIFGGYPVFFHEVGEPADEEKDLRRLQMLARQSVIKSKEKQGPVHLNFPFRKPLEPTHEALAQIQTENKKPSQSVSPNQDFSTTSLELSIPLLESVSSAQKPLIIVGPLAPGDHTASISKIADLLNAPIVTESSINSSNVVRGFSGFLRNQEIINRLNPDLIIRFGFQPTSKSIHLALQHWQPNHHFHFASTGDWQDATALGAQRIAWYGKTILWNDITSSTDPTWLKQWQQVENTYTKQKQKFIPSHKKLTDGAVYHYLTPQLNDDHWLAVSNSFPARDINLFGRQPANIPLFLNRGASGIDGITSTVLGLSIALQKPGILFIGDLALLHDTNALLNHKKLTYPLVVVVINNSGGSIFKMLPIKNHYQHFESYFETPQDVNISKLVNAYDIPYFKVNNLSQLKELEISEIMNKHRGLSIIECRTDADASMQLRKQLWDF